MTKLELLSPAKDYEYGKAAIDHGADAVYIGAPRFSARQAAGAEIHQIEKLVNYAHLYFAKVYIAFNTILFDNELDEAEMLIQQLYQAGADALIIQDMGILEMSLPPIPLFASTQTHNTTPEKIQFLEKCGFQRIILARELSLDQIRTIRLNSQIELESFIHGALCVSYSGQCYMSQAICGRSGNRGACAQPCRSAYDLVDEQGNIIEKNKHLLSLKDLNLSENIEDMADAGISSFKIEGRLKDISYLKNITSFYRQKLDAILDNTTKYQKASSGKCHFNFTPNPDKTYNRSYTQYFVHGRREKTGSFVTQKSTGVEIGKIIDITAKGFTYQGESLSQGDGICFFNKNRELTGFYVNQVSIDFIIPSNTEDIYPGAILFRNFDHEFENQLKRSLEGRKINISMMLESITNGLRLTLIDEDGIQSVELIHELQEHAKIPDKMVLTFETQLTKLGNTPFELDKLKLKLDEVYYLPISGINLMRRKAVEQLQHKRVQEYGRPSFILKPNSHPYPGKTINYTGNASNRLAMKFYKRHGVQEITSAFELEESDHHQGWTLMTTKHCIKYQLDGCPKYQGNKGNIKEPLFLKDPQHIYRLKFNCEKCEMKVILDDNYSKK